MEKYRFKATLKDEVIYPKGFYYQGNNVVLVGDINKGHTIRRKEKVNDVAIEILRGEISCPKCGCNKLYENEDGSYDCLSLAYDWDGEI